MKIRRIGGPNELVLWIRGPKTPYYGKFILKTESYFSSLDCEDILRGKTNETELDKWLSCFWDLKMSKVWREGKISWFEKGEQIREIKI